MTYKILILLSDTGGGHRASAGAVREGLVHVFGEDKFEFVILDIWTEYGSWPFNSFVSVYRFASENPWCWRWMYESSKSPISRSLFLASGYAVSGSKFKKVLEDLKPDLIISVHPLCQHVPLQILNELEEEGLHRPPFVTVVTDLGGAHPTWFHPKATRVYVPSFALLEAAKAEGVSSAQIRHYGLPLRKAFWSSEDPHAVNKAEVREKLKLKTHYPTVLVVGGGEGVGAIDVSVKSIIDWALKSSREAREHYHVEEGDMLSELQVVVVCGKNEDTRGKVLEVVRELQQSHPSNVTLEIQGSKYMGPGAVNAPPAEEATPHRPQPKEGKIVHNISKDFKSSPNRSPRSPPSKSTVIRSAHLVEDSHDPAEVNRQRELAAQKYEQSMNQHLEESLREMQDPLSSAMVPTPQASSSESDAASPNDKPVSSRPHIPSLLLGKSSDVEKSFPAASKKSVDPISQSSSILGDTVHVHVVVYSFVNNIDELMSASDLIVTKAGPGTVAEANTKALPVLLSSYMPGQEEGNVSYVIKNKFGTYCDNPDQLGLIVRQWLLNPRFEIKLQNMRIRSERCANPTASVDIARDIGKLLGLR